MKKLGINFENVLSLKNQLNVSVLEALYQVKNLGFTSLDVKYERITGENSFIKDIFASNLVIESVYSFCPFHEQDNVQKALKIVDFAFENRIKEIMFLCEFKDGGYSLEEINNVKKNLRRVIKYAKQFGVLINIENVGSSNYPFNDLDSCLDVLKSVKDLGIVFDGGNFLLYDVMPINVINSLATYVKRYHLKDRILLSSESDYVEFTASSKPSYVEALGSGNCDCLKVYEVIKEYYNDVPLVIEFPADEKNLYEKVKKSAMYVYTEMMK